MDWARWAELGVESYDVYQKQKKRKNWKSSNPSAVRGGSGTTKLGTRDKYGPYASLALKANELATEGGDLTPGHRTGRKKIPERVKSTVKIADLNRKISLGEEDDNKFYA